MEITSLLLKYYMLFVCWLSSYKKPNAVNHPLSDEEVMLKYGKIKNNKIVFERKK